MRLLSIILCLCLATGTFAQRKATTEDGKKVLLFDTGKWEYADESEKEAAADIKLNPRPFTKGETSDKLLRSKKTDVGFWMNSKKWSNTKLEEGATQEFMLKNTTKDLYAFIITERIEVPIETLKNLAYERALSVAEDAKIVSTEYRTVNSTKVLNMKMECTLQGIKFTYFGYYFSSEKGTVQFVAFTSQNLFEAYKKEAEDLLNGFVIL